MQTSVRAGTIFHESRTPLTKWFLAMHLITSAKNDIAASELSRQLDVKWDTAWLIKQKLLEAMLQRNSIYKLAGDIQIDDAYQGGEKPAIPGKTGRGARGKLPFVIAVQTRKGKPVFTQLRPISAFSKEAVEEYAKANFAKGSRVLSDGLGCWNGLDDAGMKHEPRVTGGGRPTDPDFKWVNTGLGNVKGAITGTCRSCDMRHTGRYLAGYEWRFNRRFDLARKSRSPWPGGGRNRPAALPQDRRRPAEGGGDTRVIRRNVSFTWRERLFRSGCKSPSLRRGSLQPPSPHRFPPGLVRRASRPG